MVDLEIIYALMDGISRNAIITFDKNQTTVSELPAGLYNLLREKQAFAENIGVNDITPKIWGLCVELQKLGTLPSGDSHSAIVTNLGIIAELVEKAPSD